MSELGTQYRDNLVAGDMKISTDNAVIQSGQDLKRGSVLGKVTRSVPTTGTADGGNTGNGTMVDVEGRRRTKTGTYTVECTAAAAAGGTFSVTDPDGNVLAPAYVGSYSGTGDGTLTDVKAGPKIKAGYYSVKCTQAVTNGGVFTITDPDGTVIGTATIPAGAGNSIVFNHEQISLKLTDGSTDFALNDEFLTQPYDEDQIAFILLDGSTDFIVGDKFTVAVTVGSRECKLVDSSASDGSQTAFAVLADDIDASSAAQAAPIYMSGQFNERALIFGGADTIETHRATLRDIGIFTKSSVEQGPIDDV